MANYSIKDLENLTGIKAHTIRMWEKRYELVQPERTDTNIRYYNDEDLKKLLNVSILNRYGIKISKLAHLSNDELGEKILQITRKHNDYDSQIESLIVSMIELDEEKFEKILTTSIIRFGFEEIIFNILYPFFEKVGLLWQAGTINPAQEHFISNLIKQKLMVAIDSIPMTKHNNSKIFLLFLPEWELHEIGLLVYYYFIKKRGHKVIYLGQSVPENNIYKVAEIIKPDVFITSFTSSTEIKRIVNLLKNLSQTFPDQAIYIGGLQLKEINGEMPERIKTLPNAKAFKDQIEELNGFH
ncbi:MAG: MerR family transcriptional regulator [Bacteroidota bacterium]|nr:MerR family transcriptional regulator [Bacteroidota bacterium]